PMVILGFAFAWTGYLQAVYGYCLLKGYDVRWRDLANPIRPYQWPPRGQPIATVPKSQIMPGRLAAAEGQGGPVTAAAPRAVEAGARPPARADHPGPPRRLPQPAARRPRPGARAD